MRITVVPSDKSIGVDGVIYSGLDVDWSWIPEDVHAFQWFDTYGHVEYKDSRPNDDVTELGIYQTAVDLHNQEKTRIEQEEIQKELSRDYWEEFRELRLYRLRETDWTQTLDSPLSEDKKEEYRIYRQSLRDLAGNITDPKALVENPDHPDWPTKVQ